MGIGSHEVRIGAGLGDGAAVTSQGWSKFKPEDGPIFHDGSCIAPTSAHPRAGWAAVQVNDVGMIIKAMWGSVPSWRNQDANMAEHVGLLKAMQEAERARIFYTDCATVSNAWTRGFTWAAGPRRPHGGVWREAAGLIFSGKGPCNIIKCKAHQVMEELQGREKFIAQGNDAADRKAKEGAELCNLDAHRRIAVDKQESWQQKVVKELGVALARWPNTDVLFGDLRKLDIQRSSKGDKQPFRQHDLKWIDGRRRCSICFYQPRKVGAVSSQKCTGHPPALTQVLLDRKGHSLRLAWCADSDMPTLWCARCGAFGITCPKGLKKACLGKAFGSSNGMALARVSRGTHPISGELFVRYVNIDD